MWAFRHLIRFHHYAQKIASHGVMVKDYELGLCDFPFYLRLGWCIFAGSSAKSASAGGMEKCELRIAIH